MLSLSRSQSLGRGGEEEEEEEKAVAVGSCWSTAVKSGTKARLKPLKLITGSHKCVFNPSSWCRSRWSHWSLWWVGAAGGCWVCSVVWGQAVAGEASPTGREMEMGMEG